MNLKDKTVVIDNKTYCYSKIVMLSAKDMLQSTILLGVMPNLCRLTKEVIDDSEWLRFGKPQHLYFLSTDEICEGDWVYDETSDEKIYQVNVLPIPKEYPWYKIISSTDPSLNLPKPSNSFLQVYNDAYNKNEKIEECLVEYILLHDLRTFDKSEEFEYIPKITKGEITIRKVKESWSREEVEKLCYDAWHDGAQIRGIGALCAEDWISQNL